MDTENDTNGIVVSRSASGPAHTGMISSSQSATSTAAAAATDQYEEDATAPQHLVQQLTAATNGSDASGGRSRKRPRQQSDAASPQSDHEANDAAQNIESKQSHVDDERVSAADAAMDTSEEQADPSSSPPAPCHHYVSEGPPALAAKYRHSSVDTSDAPLSLPDYDELVLSGRIARQYPFTLDPFQKLSIRILETRQHLLVAAHTSAGVSFHTFRGRLWCFLLQVF